MRLAPDRVTERWLLTLTGADGELEWDRGNMTKLEKHGVTRAEVREVVAADLFFAGCIVEPAHEEARWLVLGKTSRGRRLALIFTRRGDRLRPISCRPMRREERTLYEKARRQEA